MRRPLRAWQRQALARLARWESGPFLLSAAPGAGKTRPALELAKRLLSTRAAEGVLVLCPTAPLTRQWALAAAETGLNLQPDAPTPTPPRDFDGVSVTYARVASDERAWSAVSERTLVIADEAHHLGEELTWGSSFARAFAAARRWLLLSGTPFRSDATPIPGVSYDADGFAEPDFSYDYETAVLDGVCRPVAFVTFDGSLSWRSGEDVIESSFETVLSTREASRRYRTALSTELPEGLPRIIGEANERLVGLREREHPHAGGLVVAADIGHASRIAKLLADSTGTAPTIVLHTDGGAAGKLAAFRDGRDPWIVAVNMVSEGVDIPRLRVGVYASAAKTALIFRQIVGRFVRTLPGRPPEPSWLYLPADGVLRRHASEIESELRAALRPPGGDGDGDELFDERERWRESERGQQADFVPLSAEFAPQLTLFGPAPRVGRSGTGGSDAPDTGGLPAFERRERLRRQRTRLVGELQRRGGLSHREVNSWLNRSIGVGRVEDATIAQLERSIETLLRELSRGSGRPRT
ncbi:MAG: DEAD/DEAH box helicase [Solirubrobacteraceae bacterium]